MDQLVTVLLAFDKAHTELQKDNSNVIRLATFAGQYLS